MYETLLSDSQDSVFERSFPSHVCFELYCNILTRLQIATPGHDLYGSHLSQHVIDAMIAPKDESKDLVMQWLESEGMSDEASLSPRLDSVLIQTTVDKIEKLLNAEYSAFSKMK